MSIESQKGLKKKCILYIEKILYIYIYNVSSLFLVSTVQIWIVELKLALS
jgi:hypothetical protein